MEHTRDTIKKIRNTMVSKSNVIWMMKKDKEVMFADSLTLWAKQHNLSVGSLHQVADINHIRKSYKGWTVKRIDITLLTKEQYEIYERALQKYNPEILNKFNMLKPILTKTDLIDKYDAYVIEKSGENEISKLDENELIRPKIRTRK